MILIAHRGNINGSKPELENCPKYIDEAIEKEFNVEIDVWYKYGHFYLGHDKPVYHVDLEWLLYRADVLWVHAKNLDALVALKDTALNIFWHQNDEYTLTSKGYIWAYPTSEVNQKVIIVDDYFTPHLVKEAGGICSNNIQFHKDKLYELAL
jgi:hypothetical protein